jgi:hypothetical protein
MARSLYRTIEGMDRPMARALESIRTAILADTTADMTQAANDAMAIVNQMIHDLEDGSRMASTAQGGGGVEGAFVEATLASLNNAWNRLEAVGLEGDVAGLRARLVDAKTETDYAAAYLRASLGTQEAG